MSGKPRAVMLANAGHKPLDTRIFHKEAISLVRAGYEVVLIIPATQSLVKNEVEIIAVPLPEKGWEQLIKCPWRIFREALKQPRGSVFHLHDSELLMVGFALKFAGRKVIYDAHEDTPLQISYQHWIPWLFKGPYAWFYRFLEKAAGWFFNAIIVAEPVIAKYFPSSKVTLVRNFPITSSFSTDTPYPDRPVQMAYVGLLSKARGVTEMLDAHKVASEKVDVGFVIGGKFAPARLEQALLSKYKVNYQSWLPYEEMVGVLFSSRIGLLVPHPIERYLTNYPVKLFEYMAAGLPVIAAEGGETATFVMEANCGILVDPLNVQEIADAIVKLIGDPKLAAEMGQRGRTLIFKKYHWENEFLKLLHLYQSF